MKSQRLWLFLSAAWNIKHRSQPPNHVHYRRLIVQPYFYNFYNSLDIKIFVIVFRFSKLSLSDVQNCKKKVRKFYVFYKSLYLPFSFYNCLHVKRLSTFA